MAVTLQWRHNECDCGSNHQSHDCLLKSLFRHRWKKTSKLCVTGLCEGNSPVAGEFPAQRASNAENFRLMMSSWVGVNLIFGACMSVNSWAWFFDSMPLIVSCKLFQLLISFGSFGDYQANVNLWHNKHNWKTLASNISINLSCHAVSDLLLKRLPANQRSYFLFWGHISNKTEWYPPMIEKFILKQLCIKT